MKFEINEVWLSRDAELFVITEITNKTYGISVRNLKTNYSINLTLQGREISYQHDSIFDLVTHEGYLQDYPEYLL